MLLPSDSLHLGMAGELQSGQSATWTLCSVNRTRGVPIRQPSVEVASRPGRYTAHKPMTTCSPT